MVCVGGGFAIGISEASRRGLKRALALAILKPKAMLCWPLVDEAVAPSNEPVASCSLVAPPVPAPPTNSTSTVLPFVDEAAASRRRAR